MDDQKWALVALGIIWIALAFLPGLIAANRFHARARDVRAMGILGMFIPVLWIAAIIWAFIGQAGPRQVIGTQKQMTRRPHGYAGAKPLNFDPDFDDRNAEQVLADRLGDGPGAFTVRGVDRASKQDRRITITADSRANAQVKAELDGLIVTSIERG